MSEADRDELLAAIDRGRLPPWVRVKLRELVHRDSCSIAALADANAERQTRVRAGIHRAADRFLPGLIARGASRRCWAGALWGYLRRHEAFGLERQPCQRVVREALKNWIPPIGGAQFSQYAAGNNQEASNG